MVLMKAEEMIAILMRAEAELEFEGSPTANEIRKMRHYLQAVHTGANKILAEERLAVDLVRTLADSTRH